MEEFANAPTEWLIWVSWATGDKWSRFYPQADFVDDPEWAILSVVRQWLRAANVRRLVEDVVVEVRPEPAAPDSWLQAAIDQAIAEGVTAYEVNELLTARMRGEIEIDVTDHPRGSSTAIWAALHDLRDEGELHPATKASEMGVGEVPAPCLLCHGTGSVRDWTVVDENAQLLCAQCSGTGVAS